MHSVERLHEECQLTLWDLAVPEVSALDTQGVPIDVDPDTKVRPTLSRPQVYS